MTKLCRQYMKEVKTLFPTMGKEVLPLIFEVKKCRNRHFSSYLAVIFLFF